MLTAECAGFPEITSPWMEQHMAVGGKITQIGMGPGRANLLPIKFQQRAGMFVGSLGHSGNWDFPSVINLMANGRIDLTLVTHTDEGVHEGTWIMFDNLRLARPVGAVEVEDWSVY